MHYFSFKYLGHCLWRYRGGGSGDKFVNSGCHFVADYSLELDWQSEYASQQRKREREKTPRKSHYHLN